MHDNYAGLEAWLLPNELVVRNCITKSEYSLDRECAEFLHLCTALLERNENSAVPTLHEMEVFGLVLSKNQLLSRTDCDLVDFRAGTQYFDYSDPSTIERDARDMINYEQSSPRRYVDEDTSPVQKVLNPDNTTRELIYLCQTIFEAQEEVNFHHEIVERKIVPSLGARHGINASLMSVEGDLDSMTSRDDNSTHIGQVKMPRAARRQQSHILLCANFDRYQWRYRHSWIYQCIYLDLGHVVAAMKLLASSRGIQLDFTNVDGEAGELQKQLINEPLLKVSIKNQVQGKIQELI